MMNTIKNILNMAHFKTVRACRKYILQKTRSCERSENTHSIEFNSKRYKYQQVCKQSGRTLSVHAGNSRL